MPHGERFGVEPAAHAASDEGGMQGRSAAVAALPGREPAHRMRHAMEDICMEKRSRTFLNRLTRRQFLIAGGAVGAATLTSTDALISTSRVLASVSQPQTPLPSG